MINELNANVCTRVHALAPPDTRLYALRLHTERTRNGDVAKLGSGNWRAQVRRKGCYLSETFRRHREAEEWALDVERRIDRGETPRKRSRGTPTNFGDLIDLHVDDMKEVGKAPRRSKER